MHDIVHDQNQTRQKEYLCKINGPLKLRGVVFLQCIVFFLQFLHPASKSTRNERQMTSAPNRDTELGSLHLGHEHRLDIFSRKDETLQSESARFENEQLLQPQSMVLISSATSVALLDKGAVKPSLAFQRCLLLRQFALSPTIFCNCHRLLIA